MTQAQLPAWLAQEQPDDLANRLADNLGTGAVPYLSIEGNRFTLVDGTGAEEAIQTYDPKSGPYIDVCIIDANEKTCKIWYGEAYNPAAAAPPKCFSSNGLAPSRQAGYPQSPTCASCPKNVIGSDVSKMSGKPIKACRDYEFLAVLPPGDDMAFLLRVPPNSRTNLRNYSNSFRGQQFGMRALVTRISFVAGVQGTLAFAPVAWIDDTTRGMRDQIAAAKGTDVLVGRTDVPRTEGLPAPGMTLGRDAVGGYDPNRPVAPLPPPQQPMQQPQAFQPAPFVPNAPAPQSTGSQAPFQPPASAAVPSSTPTMAAPASPKPPKRKRRTKAEMAAAAGQAPAQPAGPQAGAPAPFMPQAQPAPAAPNGPAPAFGMAAGVAPDPQLQMTLDAHFPPAR